MPFALAIALCVWLASRRIGTFPVLFVTTMLAWVAATGLVLPETEPPLARLILVGAVGAGGTYLGCAIAAPVARRPLPMVLTVAVGAVAATAGIVLVPGVFPIWQSAVAFCIGLGLSERRWLEDWLANLKERGGGSW